MAGAAARRRLPEAQRRRVILEAATDVVAERGAEAASISMIAERAGITRPIVYDHFPTKRDLILALIEQHHTTLMAVLGAIETGTSLDEAALRRLIVAYLHQVDADPGGWRVLCLETSRDPEIAKVQRRTSAEVNLMVAQLLNPARPLRERLMVAEAARAAVNALAAVRQNDPRVGIETVAGMAIALLWDGLRRF
jgi:AcrR family transcriptional regulator